MDNIDGITRAHNKILVSEYDRMMKCLNDSYYLIMVDKEKFEKFVEFRKTCTVPIESFEEKVSFMLQFNKKIDEDKRNKEKETLKKEKEKLIELAKKRYESKSALWKVFNKKINPDKINFDNMSASEINELYNDETNKKTR